MLGVSNLNKGESRFAFGDPSPTDPTHDSSLLVDLHLLRSFFTGLSKELRPVSLVNASRALHLVGMGWPTSAATERYGIGPTLAELLVNEPLCIPRNDPGLAHQIGYGDLSILSAQDIWLIERSKEHMKQAHIGDASSYVEPLKMDAIGRACYNNSYGVVRNMTQCRMSLLVLGTQIEPVVRLGGSGVTTNSIVDFLTNSYPGDRLLKSFERAGISVPRNMLTSYNLALAQKRFRQGRENWSQALNAYISNELGEDLSLAAFEQVWFWEDSNRKKSIAELEELRIQDIKRRMTMVLNEREQLVITKRYLTKNIFPITLTQLANELGVSREAVRQTELKALSKLTHPAGRKLNPMTPIMNSADVSEKR